VRKSQEKKTYVDTLTKLKQIIATIDSDFRAKQAEYLGKVADYKNIDKAASIAKELQDLGVQLEQTRSTYHQRDYIGGRQRS
jgi:hypothetical protein